MNIHIIGVIVLLAGVLGLLLSLLVWSPLNPNRRRSNPPGGYESGPPPQVVQYNRTFRDEPPVVQERGTYRDEPPR